MCLCYFPLQNYVIFLQVVKDLFSGLPKLQGLQPRTISSQGRCFNIEAALEATVQSAGLIPHKPWLQKAVELYNISQVHQGRSRFRGFGAQL